MNLFKWCFRWFNNEIVGFHYGNYEKINDTELVIKSILKANNFAKKLNNSLKRTIFHSDHGIQYNSFQMKKIKEKLNFIQSMSRKGNSLDNHPIEYFFSILKQEYLKDYFNSSFKEIKKQINFAIKDYNKFQSNLKYLTPVDYRNQIF